MKIETVSNIIEERAKRIPERTAIKSQDGKSVTYRELNEMAAKIASELNKAGVQKGDFVALLAERTVETIAAIYGIIKIGAVYVPINKRFPAERVFAILKDCGASAVVNGGDIYRDKGYTCIDLSCCEKDDEEAKKYIQTKGNADDTAACLYTSGSTGMPKGVLLDNKALLCRVRSCTKKYNLTKYKNILQISDLSFVTSIYEIFAAHYVKGYTQLVDESTILNLSALESFLDEKKIDVFVTRPSYLKYIEVPECIRLLVIGGERVHKSDIEHTLKNNQKTKYAVVYGMSETGGIVTAEEERKYSSEDEITIGREVENAEIYIVNEDGRICEAGEEGELCVAGEEGLATGYLNRPEIMRESFVENPFGDGRLYKTGDLARRRADGKIEYLGRIDEQVKIRGQRIELGEIETNIRKIEEIKDCAVTTREDSNGDTAICAYLVSESRIDITRIREDLSRILPEYMIPSYMTQIDRIPMTENGKVNKKALPEINIQSEREYVAPKNETEKIICNVFS